MNKQLIQNIINYIDVSDQALKKLASDNRKFVERNNAYQHKVHESLVKLASVGIIESDNVDYLYNTMKDNPEKVAEFLSLTAKTPSMGKSSDHYNGNQLDAIAQFALGE
jgi:ABC-type transporter Mla subunit MlaD